MTATTGRALPALICHKVIEAQAKLDEIEALLDALYFRHASERPTTSEDVAKAKTAMARIYHRFHGRIMTGEET